MRILCIEHLDQEDYDRLYVSMTRRELLDFDLIVASDWGVALVCCLLYQLPKIPYESWSPLPKLTSYCDSRLTLKPFNQTRLLIPLYNMETRQVECVNLAKSPNLNTIITQALAWPGPGATYVTNHWYQATSLLVLDDEFERLDVDPADQQVLWIHSLKDIDPSIGQQAFLHNWGTIQWLAFGLVRLVQSAPAQFLASHANYKVSQNQSLLSFIQSTPQRLTSRKSQSMNPDSGSLVRSGSAPVRVRREKTPAPCGRLTPERVIRRLTPPSH